MLLPDGVLLGYDSRGSNNDGHIGKFVFYFLFLRQVRLGFSVSRIYIFITIHFLLSVSDEVEKVKELTSKPSQMIKRQNTSPAHSPIVATMEGNVRQCRETWKFLEDNISLQGLRCSKPVTYTATLGLTYIRTLTTAEQQSSCYIAGMQEKVAIFILRDYLYISAISTL